MTDDAIVRIAEVSADAMKHMDPHIHSAYLIPSYVALLAAAKANHPNDPFISSLASIEVPNGDNEIRVGELRVLFGQLRIALESLCAEAAAYPPPR